MKLLFLDIETAPILGYVWGLWNNDIGLNQIYSDTHLLSFAAKWQGTKEVMYSDQRKAQDVTNDRDLAKEAWKLLDSADIIVTQNGKAFDVKRLNARFIVHGLKPPSSFKHIDTKIIAKKHFGFTSNKLDYLADKLDVEHKKSHHKKFPGFELWIECLKGNQEAWKEMEQYNKLDVLALEGVYNKLVPWDSSVDFAVLRGEAYPICSCGSTHFVRNGYSYTSTGKYQRYQCKKCGSEQRSKKNLIKGAVLRPSAR